MVPNHELNQNFFLYLERVDEPLAVPDQDDGGRSRSLICHEQPEQFAHGRSFVLSDLSDSLKVAHLS